MLRRADRLGLEMSMAASGGWSEERRPLGEPRSVKKSSGVKLK